MRYLRSARGFSLASAPLPASFYGEPPGAELVFAFEFPHGDFKDFSASSCSWRPRTMFSSFEVAPSGLRLQTHLGSGHLRIFSALAPW